MATYSTGITATWGGVAFSEIYDLSVSRYGNIRQDRTLNASSQGWSDSAGTVSLSTYGTANMSDVEYGTRKQLSVSGGGFTLTVQAVCTAVSVAPELNGMTKFTFTAEILE